MTSFSLICHILMNVWYRIPPKKYCLRLHLHFVVSDLSDIDSKRVNTGFTENLIKAVLLLWAFLWASMRQNLSLGLLTRLCSNKPAQLQRLPRILSNKGITNAGQTKRLPGWLAYLLFSNH